MEEKTYHVYILTNDRHTVLYTGVTGDISRRIEEHRYWRGSKFTTKYNAKKLVFIRTFGSPYEAITEEKTHQGRVTRKEGGAHRRNESGMERPDVSALN